jgi:hypothetical protein
MFCGECGRKVTQVAAPPELVEPPVPEPTVAIDLPRAVPERLPAFLEAPDVESEIPVEPEFAVELEDDIERTILVPRRRAAWTVTGPDGVPHAIRVATVIGRAPQRPANRRELELLSIVDDTKSLSKSHAIVDPTGDEMTIEDLNSTNGIVIIAADGSETELPSGRAVALEIGTVLGLGDCVLTIGRTG